MKSRVNLDRRGEADRKFDDMWNKLCRDARLTPIQSSLVAKYVRELLGIRMHEVESAVDMGWLISLIEGEGFGTDVSKGATRLLRVQQKACEARNEAFGKGCFNANGSWDNYDGCGLEHLKVRLARYNVQYDTGI